MKEGDSSYGSPSPRAALRAQRKGSEPNQFDRRFHPWPGWPDNVSWCTRCTFKPRDDYEALAEKLVERMHMYGTAFPSEPHQTGEAYNNLIRMAAFELRAVGRLGVRAALAKARKLAT